VALKKGHKLGANTVLHEVAIVAQFLKRHGRNGITRELQLPERITSLPKEYREQDLGRLFDACFDFERALFSTFLLTGADSICCVKMVAKFCRSSTITSAARRRQMYLETVHRRRRTGRRRPKSSAHVVRHPPCA
jgi:hypothetical protein